MNLCRKIEAVEIPFTTHWANSADDKLMIFFPDNRLNISCKLSTLETICLKCQDLFSGQNKIFFFLLNISSAENFAQSAKH